MGKLLPKNEDISREEAHTNTRKLNWYISTIADVFLDQKRVNVCEHMVKMAPSLGLRGQKKEEQIWQDEETDGDCYLELDLFTGNTRKMKILFRSKVKVKILSLCNDQKLFGFLLLIMVKATWNSYWNFMNLIILNIKYDKVSSIYPYLTCIFNTL